MAKIEQNPKIIYIINHRNNVYMNKGIIKCQPEMTYWRQQKV